MYSLESHARGYLIFSMFVFGTVGLFVHYIPLPSSIIALSRASLGAAFLFLLVRFSHMPMSKEQIRDNLKLLIISGICIGINWILLFEAFRHTTLAIASICYYMAPVFVILVSPVLLHETLTARKVVCVLLALLGMMFVSGIFENGLSDITDLSGVFFALGAAVFYASVIVCNKKFSPISAYDKTIIQLAAAAVVLLPYTLITENWSALSCTPFQLFLLLVLSLFVTGFAYSLFFGAMGYLKAQTVAILTYIDPIVAVFLSALFLQEPLAVSTIIGAVLILGSTLISELRA